MKIPIKKKNFLSNYMIHKIENIIRNLLPSPFTIAIILTFAIIILAKNLTETNLYDIISLWEIGLWNSPLMNFAMQMMLMLVLGYVLALTNLFKIIIEQITRFCNNSANAAFIVAFSTILVSFFNWGLGLVFGAILARKVAENALKKNISLNYPLIGAAGYSGLMVWHGGLSGSIPLKIAEKNHFEEVIIKSELLNQLPSSGINFSETVLSSMNITVSIFLLIIIPLVLFYVGKCKPNGPQIIINTKTKHKTEKNIKGAEYLDHSTWFTKIIGFAILMIVIKNIYHATSLSFITPNFINLLLLGLCLFLHKNILVFLKSLNEAITSASGILIQFPLYFGIMGIMNGSGLVDIFADFFVSISNTHTYPILTMISGGIINIFVPSGGGQWAVQGPIILQSSIDLGVDIPKSIMALVYGDQLTNMLQPFWALPLLGITNLKAKEIFPYTLIIMLIGIAIFTTALIIF